MKSKDELARENGALRERIATLNAATLRISASLDVETVLTGIVESARALTSARYGVITTIDNNGQIEGFTGLPGPGPGRGASVPPNH